MQDNQSSWKELLAALPWTITMVLLIGVSSFVVESMYVFDGGIATLQSFTDLSFHFILFVYRSKRFNSVCLWWCLGVIFFLSFLLQFGCCEALCLLSAAFPVCTWSLGWHCGYVYSSSQPSTQPQAQLLGPPPFFFYSDPLPSPPFSSLSLLSPPVPSFPLFSPPLPLLFSFSILFLLCWICLAFLKDI